MLSIIVDVERSSETPKEKAVHKNDFGDEVFIYLCALFIVSNLQSRDGILCIYRLFQPDTVLPFDFLDSISFYT